jgi:hypothetical protein
VAIDELPGRRVAVEGACGAVEARHVGEHPQVTDAGPAGEEPP